VGIGVQKAGTSWWYELLVAHPSVSSRPGIHKERHFLSRFGTASFGPEQVAAYHGWFPRRPGTLAGEWTPDYLDFPWVPALLTLAAPQARLIVMVRDPVERFRSGMAHERRQGRAVTDAVVADALARPDRLLVLQYEQCAQDPAGQLARTYRFLGIDDAFVPPDLRRPVGVTTNDKAEMADDARQRLVDAYRSDVAALAEQFPHLDLGLWPNFVPRPVS
jgi:hypothetical protein